MPCSDIPKTDRELERQAKHEHRQQMRSTRLVDVWTTAPVALPIFVVGNPDFLSSDIVLHQTEPSKINRDEGVCREAQLTSVAILLGVSPSSVS